MWPRPVDMGPGTLAASGAAALAHGHGHGVPHGHVSAPGTVPTSPVSTLGSLSEHRGPAAGDGGGGGSVRDRFVSTDSLSAALAASALSSSHAASHRSAAGSAPTSPSPLGSGAVSMAGSPSPYAAHPRSPLSSRAPPLPSVLNLP